MTTLYRLAPNFYARKDYAETWNIVDPWGRELGFKATTYKVQWGVELSPSEHYGTSDSSKLEISALFNNVEKRFAAEVSATRNNKKYGASQPIRYFQTEEELNAYFAKYRRDAQKRALKSVEKQKARRT